MDFLINFQMLNFQKWNALSRQNFITWQSEKTKIEESKRKKVPKEYAHTHTQCRMRHMKPEKDQQHFENWFCVHGQQTILQSHVQIFISILCCLCWKRNNHFLMFDIRFFFFFFFSPYLSVDSVLLLMFIASFRDSTIFGAEGWPPLMPLEKNEHHIKKMC